MPTLLYSTNTWLAYTISQTYYGGEHYVWCSPHPNSRWLPVGLAPLPPSSSPGDLYLSLHADIRGGDLHSAKIGQNREGILRGARVKRAAGIISEGQFTDIDEIVATAGLRDFRPLLFVIPFAPVADRAEAVSLARRASLFHEEYTIERLPRPLFDVIELLEI
jgi:hypothetical protein